MLGHFITGETLTEQFPSGKWRTVHNQLFMDEDGSIYLVPRNEVTDGYSYPLGGRMASWDIRPAVGHDLECEYHQEILVNLSFADLINHGYIKNKSVHGTDILICENIPAEFLEIRNTTFLGTNAKFKRMMKAVGISGFWVNAMFAGVHLNISWAAWFLNKKRFDINNIYKL